MKQLIFVLVVLGAMLPTVARGQVELLFFLLDAPATARLLNPDKNDAGRTVLSITAPPKDFVGDVRTVAEQLGYQIEQVGTPSGKLSAQLVKQNESLLASFAGKNWQMRVTVSLDTDGKSIEITSGLKGNDPKASGTAQEAVEKVRERLEKIAASRLPVSVPEPASEPQISSALDSKTDESLQ